jgi:prepilin-type N-terminal cleavage/methylation domain-containing protein/prepilin-type processing-associated H-X9-DG protein
MSARSVRPRGFTLVELLVVIGIIALLISILMPALSRARDHANAIKCLSNMRQIGQAYLMHATEHRNHVPTAGLIHPPWSATPAGLGDTAKVKYLYYGEGSVERPLPMPAALATYFGQKFNASNPVQLKEEMSTGPCQDLFVCPTQGLENIMEGQMLTDFSWAAPLFKSSYIFNEEPLGFMDSPPIYQRGRGNLSRMKQTSDTMMLMEGKPRGNVPGGWLVIFALKNDTVLEDAFNGNAAGDRTNFEFARHKGRVNMIFMDGHAELVTTTTRPNYNIPNTVKYNKKIYTVPTYGFF